MKKIISTGLFAGILVFAWSAFSWMVLPWHQTTLNKVVNAEEVTQVMMKNAQPTSSKIYKLPDECKPATPTEPHIFIAYVPRHLTMMQSMLIGLLIQILTATVISILISKMLDLGYSTKVFLISFLGFIIGINSYGANWNYWGFAPDYSLVGIADCIISWLLGGLVIAKRIDGSKL